MSTSRNMPTRFVSRCHLKSSLRYTPNPRETLTNMLGDLRGEIDYFHRSCRSIEDSTCRSPIETRTRWARSVLLAIRNLRKSAPPHRLP